MTSETSKPDNVREADIAMNQVSVHGHKRRRFFMRGTGRFAVVTEEMTERMADGVADCMRNLAAPEPSRIQWHTWSCHVEKQKQSPSKNFGARASRAVAVTRDGSHPWEGHCSLGTSFRVTRSGWRRPGYKCGNSYCSHMDSLTRRTFLVRFLFSPCSAKPDSPRRTKLA